MALNQQTLVVREHVRKCLANAFVSGLGDVLGERLIRVLVLESDQHSSIPLRQAPMSSSVGPLLQRPYADALADALLLCKCHGSFQRPPLPTNKDLVDLLVDQEADVAFWEDAVVKCLGGISYDVQGVDASSFSLELQQQMSSLLRQLGSHGVLAALGQRRTIGTCEDLLPPTRDELLRSFHLGVSDASDSENEAVEDEHKETLEEVEARQDEVRSRIKALKKSRDVDDAALRVAMNEMQELTVKRRALLSTSPQLTVGARAVAKHHHRASSYSFWTDLAVDLGISFAGSDSNKNASASAVITWILDRVVWSNIYGVPGLPHRLVELRIPSGHGARWIVQPDGTRLRFRGLLDPLSADDRASGWSHQV